MADNRTLIISRTAPYTSTQARTELDTALAFAAFDQPATLLLLGPAVCQLIEAQDGHIIGRKHHARILSSLPLYGIDKVYVDADSARQFSVTEHNACLPIVLLDTSAIQALIARHTHTVSL